MNTREQLLKDYDFDDYSRQPISFYYCQSGFHPDACKKIHVWTRESFEKGKAVLVRSDGERRLDIDLKDSMMNMWGRQEWVVDISAVTEPGTYRLDVDFAGTAASSADFRISPDLYDILMEKAAKHVYIKRCGIFCHTHDANVYSLDPENFGETIGHRDVSGGWHDAHDDNKWVVFMWMILYGLLKVEESFRPAWSGSHELLSYCLAEAWWGVEWLIKMQKKDGGFHHGVFEWVPEKRGDSWVMQVHDHNQDYDDLGDDRRALVDVWGPNAVCKLMGKEHGSTPSTAPKYFAYLAHVIRKFSRLVRSQDREIAERCKNAAALTVKMLESTHSIPECQVLEVSAGLALYCIESFRESRDASMIRMAEARLNEMLNLQQPDGYFYASSSCRGLEAFPEEAGDERVYLDYPFGYMFALVEYLELISAQLLTDSETGDRVRNALCRFCGMLERHCRSTLFEQPSELRFDRDPHAVIPLSIARHGYNPYILSVGSILAAGSRLLGNGEWRRLAERQLQWVLGANPRFMSFMNQEGVRNSGQYAAGTSSTRQYYKAAFYRHLGNMRWGVTTGICGPEEGDPVNYAHAGHSMSGKYDAKCQETWLNANGWMLMLLSQLKMEDP